MANAMVVGFALIFSLICGVGVVALMVGVAVARFLFILSLTCVVDVVWFDGARVCGFIGFMIF